MSSPFLLALLLTGAASSVTYAQTSDAPQRSMQAIRLQPDERVIVDGRLDEPFWSRALPATNFIQQDPENGAPATEPTEVRIVYTADALYIGVICFDSEPDQWLGYQRRRDEFLQSDDRFMWTIDTFLDGRTAYFFEMNPSGLMGDALRGPDLNNRQWDGIWDAEARIDERGWILEIEIPFQTLNFDPGSAAWGINFQRTVRRKNEESLWMGWLYNQGLNRMTNAGLLTGISNVSQGRGLEIRPYGLFTWDGATSAVPGRRRSRGDAGGDVFYSVTPQLRAVATINTDFAQTEVDQRQVNLTRFSLFFPERRSFFLDGSPFFDFRSAAAGGVAGIVNPFFTRQIGLGADGTAQRVNFGTKLTGKAGQQDIGIMHVQTGEDGSLVGEDFTAIRLKRRLLSQSYVGGLYTRRAERGDASSPAAHTAGLDFLFGTSSFLGSQNLQVGGYYLNAAEAGSSGGQSAAYGASIEYPNDLWSGEVVFREVQRNFAPAVGFVTRTGYRLYAAEVVFGPRPNVSWLRQYTVGAEFDLLLSPSSGRTLTRVFEVPFTLDLQSQDDVSVSVINSHEFLEEDFRLGNATLAAGRTFDFTRLRAAFSTANHRTIAVTPSVEVGQFFSGHRSDVGLNLTLRVRPGLIAYLSGEMSRVDLPEGTPFTTRLYRGVLETQFSPWLAVVNNLQYDTQSRVLGWQSRFRWIIQPGNDLYVVYTHNWREDLLETGRRGFATTAQRAASKVIYTVRF